MLKIEKLNTNSFLAKPNQYHLRPYHLKSLILNFENMLIENSVVYNYSQDRCLTFEKRCTNYFIEISYLTIDKNFLESEKLEKHLIKILKNQIILNDEKYYDLTILKRDIKKEKLFKKFKKLNKV